MKERFKIVHTVGLILINDSNEILLMKRQNTGYMDNMYALVSGHLEPKETLMDAIIRETKEEININLFKDDLKYVCAIRRGSNYTYINNYFKCHKYSGIIKNMEEDKCSELKWFNLNNLPENMIPNDQRAIINMHNNVVLDEYDF